MSRKAKFTQEDVDNAVWLYKATSMSIAAIARRMDCSPPVIVAMIDGKYRPREPKKNHEVSRV